MRPGITTRPPASSTFPASGPPPVHSTVPPTAVIRPSRTLMEPSTSAGDSPSKILAFCMVRFPWELGIMCSVFLPIAGRRLAGGCQSVFEELDRARRDLYGGVYGGLVIAAFRRQEVHRADRTAA